MGVHIYEILRSDTRTRPGNFPVLQETALGWTLSGQTPAFTQLDPQHTFLLREDNSLEQNLNRLWNVEPMETSTMTTEQQSCEEHHHPQNQTIRWNICGQTSNQNGTQTAWRFSPLCRAKITCHLTQARKGSRPQGPVQLHEGIRRIRSHGTCDVPRDEENMLLPDTSSSLQSNKYHNKKKPVVFGGGAKTSNVLSLNDILQLGPTVQQDLYSNVPQFRTHQVCFTADIAKMYRQIIIQPQNRIYKKFYGDILLKNPSKIQTRQLHMEPLQ
jgi:hypothetical protein